MAVTETTATGNGSTILFPFTFEYIDEADVKVSLDGTTLATTAYDFANATTIEFNSIASATATQETTGAPKTSVAVRIFRETDVDDLKTTFFAGSSIRADDLNDNFLQNNYRTQELTNNTWDKETSTIHSNETWVSNDTQIATTAAMDARFQDEATETITSAETWPDNDDTVATTAAIDDRVDAKIDTAITGDILIDSTGLTKTTGSGQTTLGIGANSVDLDRIKNDDIITSSETWANSDSQVATTQAIDNRIDAAINNDVLVDSTGLTKTSSGGQVTLGIGSNSVDFDRIKNDDIITYAEQNAGSPSPADTNIFTASAAARRFDTIVQQSTPSGSDWEVGKTWLQNDSNLTVSIWNGSAWSAVASGGSFRTQDKVIYVDKSGGDDAQTGHRISNPKATIKSAINDINADIDTSIKTAGSGYTDGTYNNVALVGGTTGSGLQANFTISSGAVTACTVTSAATLQEYQIGDILTVANSNVGGTGSGFELEVTGGGDGMTVIVAAGTYQEAAPIQIKRRNVSIVGMALRSCLVHPTVATQGDQSTGNHALFELNSGSFLQNLTLTGMKANNSGTNTLDAALPDRQGWNFAFYDDCVITKSPYIQNCTNFSDSQIDNSNLNSHNPAGGQAGDLTNAPTGGGMLVDGSVPKSTSPLRSMVADSYTHVGLNGPGILVTNNGYAQCTSSYAFFNKYHIKALNGGQANLAASTTDFGERALVADGKSTSAIFTASVNGAENSGATTFDVDGLSAGTGWFGDDTKPATNMLVEVNSVIYPILSATAITGGYTVEISRPNPTNRSQNQGLNGAITDNASVSFYLRSQIASSGHTMEYVGSGMDYDALPENGGVPDETRQITELNNGKVWTAITDHNGKFKIGGNQTDDPIFEVDQQRGFITIPTGSIAFNLLSDTTPQLGGNLDVNGNDIVSVSNGDINIRPNGTGVVNVDSTITTSVVNGDLDLRGNGTGDVLFSGTSTIKTPGTNALTFETGNLIVNDKLTNVTDPTNAQDAATKNYVDTTTTANPIYVAVAGDTMSGALAMGTNKVTGVGDPTAAQDAATKNYVDTQLAGISSDKINEGNTEAEVVDTGSDGHFKVTTEGSERVRVGPSGQIGIAGANYGTSGQVLTSGGSSGAVSWADAASGAVAGGAIYECANEITASYSITANTNGLSAGPITIASGQTVTIPSTSNWTIV